MAWTLALAAAPALPEHSPLFFEALPNDSTPSYRFVSRGQNYLFGIGAAEAQIVLQKHSGRPADNLPGREKLAARGNVTLRTVQLKFVGANPAAAISGDGELPGKINYFIGANPGQWRCGVPIFSKVRVPELYPGISLVYYGNHKQLEYDFELAPGADPRLITLRLEGMDSLRINNEGDLMIRLGDEEVRQARPEIYQVFNGVRQPVEGSYRLKDADTVEVAVDKYNPAIPLVIDPQLSYSSYFGGTGNETAFAIKVDTNTGAVYLAGETLSATAFLTPTNSYGNTFKGGKVNGDAFIAEFDSTLANPLYFTYFGGTNDDAALDLAIDSSGHPYITGFTASTDFPTKLPDGAFGLTLTNRSVFDSIARAYPISAFVAEFDTTKSGPDSLQFSGYLGGNSADEGIGLALDQSANIYVTGYTYSTNFPTPNGFQTNRTGSNDVFVVKIGPHAAGGVLYGSLLGGTNIDEGQGIAASSGLAFVTGYTGSTNFFVRNALQPGINGTLNNTNAFAVYKGKIVPLDAFVAVFDTSASGDGSLLYSSYFGGTNNDAGYRITLDANLNAYITGNTTSTNFPDTTNHVILNQGVHSNSFNYDAILAKFSSLTTAPARPLSFSFGGTLNDVGWDIALDPAGEIFIVGVTASVTNFTTINTNTFLRSTNMGADDAFVIAFAPDATSLLYSVLLGGSKNDFGYGIAVDNSGSAYITGQTYSTNTAATTTNGFPIVGGALQSRSRGTNDAFLAKILLDHPTNGPISASVIPSSQTNLWGSNTTFTASVSGGTPPFTYQWKRNGVNLANGTHIGGATSSSVTISNITAADSGNYTVGVSNSAGGVISSAGVLTELAPPPTISSIHMSGGNVVIAFSSTNPFDTTATFTLQSAGVITGPYTNNPSGSFSGSAGSFQVTVPKGGDTMFYRLKHVD